MMSRVDGLPHRDIAAVLSVTVRTVETDLKQAVEHCAERMKRHPPGKFAFRHVASSYDQRRARRGKSLATGVRGKAPGRAETNKPGKLFGSVDP
jgi:RNA polymerase sigma-70 factor (ECF subfamily)